QESQVAKLVSLLVKLGALIFIVGLPTQYAITLQLLGGIWILQTLPAVIIGLYTRWLHRTGLLLGWLVGMVVGTWMAVAEKFQSSVFPLHLGGAVIPGYAALWALIANFVVAIVLTAILRAAGVAEGLDHTRSEDYEHDVPEGILGEASLGSR
ncbi:MAG: sodium:solute symporter, partial [Firmicutes bacterium]|nr:sodium:solute symporter [Bacillota bacterium]